MLEERDEVCWEGLLFYDILKVLRLVFNMIFFCEDGVFFLFIYWIFSEKFNKFVFLVDFKVIGVKC